MTKVRDDKKVESSNGYQPNEPSLNQQPNPEQEPDARYTVNDNQIRVQGIERPRSTAADFETLAFSSATPVFDALIRARCESMAEQNMAAGFAAAGFDTRVVFRAICHGDLDLLEQKVMGIHLRAGMVTQQHPMPAGGKDYRLDFALPRFQIGVEVDGHDWHEKTKQQASRDRARDRAIQRIGWRVLRFTGSDVYRNAAQCVREVLEDALKSPLSVEKIDPKPSKQIDVAWSEQKLSAEALKERTAKALASFKGKPVF